MFPLTCNHRNIRHSSAWHLRTTTPTLAKTTFNLLATFAKPMALRDVLKVVQQFSCSGLLGWMGNPNLWHTLVRWQLTSCAAKVLTLYCGFNAVSGQCVRPQCCNDQIGSLGK
jgi:hypothetical protein